MTPTTPEALKIALQVIAVLDELGVAYHAGGSYASSIHGVPRQTQDIDLVAALDRDTAAALVRRLAKNFYGDTEAATRAVDHQRSFNLIHLATGFKIDLFVSGSKPFDRAEWDRSQPHLISEPGAPPIIVKSAEDTLLRKLSWYRDGGQVSDRQWSDVLGIVRTQGSGLDRVYLQRWAPELGVEDLLARSLAEA